MAAVAVILITVPARCASDCAPCRSPCRGPSSYPSCRSSCSACASTPPCCIGWTVGGGRGSVIAVWNDASMTLLSALGVRDARVRGGAACRAACARIALPKIDVTGEDLC